MGNFKYKGVTYNTAAERSAAMQADVNPKYQTGTAVAPPVTSAPVGAARTLSVGATPVVTNTGYPIPQRTITTQEDYDKYIGQNRNVLSSAQAAFQKLKSGQMQTAYGPQFAPTYTPEQQALLDQMQTTSTGAQQGLDLAKQQQQGMPTLTAFEQMLQTVLYNNAMTANQPWVQAGQATAGSLLALPEELGTIEGFAGLGLDQARRVAALEEAGLTNLLGGITGALEGRRDRLDKLVETAGIAYSEELQKNRELVDQKYRELELALGQEQQEFSNEFSIVQLQMQTPEGMTFELGGQTYEGKLKLSGPTNAEKLDAAEAGYTWDANGNLVDINDSAFQSTFKVGQAYGWCGKYGNDITEGVDVGDEWSDKIKYRTNRDNPQVGNMLALPLGTWGHIAVVTGFDPTTGNISVVESNADGRQNVDSSNLGVVTTGVYNINDLQSTYGDNWGFIPTTLKAEYQTVMQAQQTPIELSEMKEMALGTATKLLEKFEKGEGTASVGLSRILPFAGWWQLPGTDPASFENLYNTLKSQLSLDSIEYLKGQGTITDAERALLAQAITELNIGSQSEEEFGESLRKIINTINGLKGISSQSYSTTSTGGLSQEEVDALF